MVTFHWTVTKEEKQKKRDNFTILIRVKAAAWRFNQLDNCVLPCKAAYRSFTAPKENP